MIVATKELKDELQSQFKCSRGTLSMALNFKLNSLRARRMRLAAMNSKKSFYLPNDC